MKVTAQATKKMNIYQFSAFLLIRFHILQMEGTPPERSSEEKGPLKECIS